MKSKAGIQVCPQSHRVNPHPANEQADVAAKCKNKTTSIVTATVDRGLARA